MAEAELNRDAALWTLPGSRSKNGRESEIPLAPLALEIIGEPRTGKVHMFGRGRSGFSGWSKSKARLDQRLASTGAEMKPWVLHDLRRSFVTLMNELGIAAPHVVEVCVNHLGGVGKSGVAGVYNKAVYRREKAAAMDAWADFVADLIAGQRRPGNVVALASVAR
jgi:integrase